MLSKLPKQQQGKIQPTTVRLINASGKPMDLEGKINLIIKIADMKLAAECHVVTHLQHPIILGMDFLREYGANIDLEQNRVHIGGREVCLTPEDVVQSFGRLTQDIAIPPQYKMSCELRAHNKLGLKTGDLIQVTSVDTGFFGKEPGICILNGVGKVYNKDRVHAVLVNNTGRQANMKKGNVIGIIEKTSEADIDINLSELNHIELNNIKAEDKCVIHHAQATADQIAQLQKLLEDNDDLFAKHDYDIGRTELIEARIKVTNETPIRKKPYAVPLALREAVKKQIEDLVENGVIRESNSPWAFPLIVVRKKNGKLRLCIDYRLLNDRTEKFYWPLGSIDDIFASLGGARYLSSLDMANAYHHIPMAPEDIPKTAFVCEQGLFEYGDKIDKRGHRDSGTLEQRPDPMLSPFPRRVPSGSVRSKSNTVGPTMSYRAGRQQAMSSSDSSSGNHSATSPVKVPEKGAINKDNGGNRGEVENTLSESTSDSDSNIPLAQSRDKLGMQDLQDQMSRLSTKEIPDERDRTVPSGGATGAQQSQSQDTGDVIEKQSKQRTQNAPLPSIKLTKVDGKWRAERLGRLVRVGDTWTRQPLEKVDDVEMVEILTGLNDGSNSGIRGSLRSKADQGATSNIGRTLEKRKLQNLTQRLQRLQKKLKDRKVAHGMSGRKVKSS